jgi:predicted ATPase
MFLSTLVIDALQQGILWHNPRGWEVAGGMEALLSGVPDSLQQLIDQRLTQLPAADQEILEVASVAGKAFTAAAVATILPHAAYHLDRQCAALARQGQFIAEQGDSLWPDGTVTTCYVFRHDLYQATLYARVSAGQRLQWHRQIGRRLVDAYGKRAPELAVELAEHFMRGQALNEALPYLEDAGQQAMQRHAYAAAQTHLTTALTILRTLPATVPHRQRALRLHLALGETLLMRHGPTAPEVRHAYSQAQALCQDSTPTSQHFAALAGLWRVALNRPHLPTAQALAEQCVTLAHPQDEPALFQEAQMMQGATALYRGALPQALVCLEQAAYAAMDAVAHPQQGTVPAVVCRARMAWVVWLLGLPERACQIVQDALALAQELAHPFSVAFALHYATVVHLACGALALARQHAHTTLLLCDDYGFTFFGAMATFLQEVTTALLEPGSFSSPHLQRRLDAIQATGSALWRPYGIALCAMTSQTPAEVSSALHLLAEACTLAERTEERYYGAEVARLRGECWLRQQPPAPQEALQSFQEALTMARAQQAQSLALRAALSLSRLWQQQGKPAQAYALLHDVYSGFTEGFATADLRTASTFLEDLAQGR